MKTVELLRFSGDFKRLKPMGYKFGKYYANNYIAYNLLHPEAETIDLVLIWKAEKDLKFDNVSPKYNVMLYKTLKQFKDTQDVINSFEPYQDEDFNPICVQIFDNQIKFINFETHCFIEHFQGNEKVLKSLEKREKNKTITEKDFDLLQKVRVWVEKNKQHPQYEELMNSERLILGNEMVDAFFTLINNDMLTIIQREVSED